MTTYKIVAEHYAFDGPVRSICIGPLGEIVAGNQSDSPSVKRWMFKDKFHFEQVGDSLFHDHWVVAVTSLPPGKHPAFPDGCIVTGCMDSKIRIFDSIGNPIHEIIGHEKGVISFSWTSTGDLISGSWDGTARLWSLEQSSMTQMVQSQCKFILGSHENGVHVLGLPDGRIVTTSTGEAVNEKPANFKVRIWDGTTGRLVSSELVDHSGPIRGACALPGMGGFATCSNDGTVVMRTGDGVAVGTSCHPRQHDGSPPFVLDCALLDTTSGLDVVSVGEDGSVCVWQGTELVQCIQHPTSVWCALAVPRSGGDFITCGHDGVLRVFSRQPVSADDLERSQALQFQLKTQVQDSQKRKQQGPSQDEIQKAKRWEDRGSVAGKSDNAVMVFNKDGKLIAAQWTADTRAWIEIGEVTGNGDGGNINGEQFDHIMPVEIDGAGGTTLSLQLGYNNMENPYEAAQRFIDQNSLPQHYLKQIADWIVSRAGKQTPSLGASDTSSNTPSVRHYQHIPVKAYLVHDEIPPSFKSKIISKMSEFNTTYAGTHSLLSESEITVISDLIGVLEETSFYHSSTIDATLLAPVVKMAIHWDASKAFPAFDILRMTALHSAGSRSIASLPHFAKLFDRIVTIVSDPTATASTVLTALRFLGNAFRYEELKRSVLKFGISKMSALLDSLQSLLYTNKSNNKSIRIAASILALNLSVAMNLTSLQSYSIDPYLPVCLKLIQHLSSWLTLETESSEFIYRYIVSVGTLVLTNKAFSGEVVSTCVTAGLQTMLTLLSTMGTTDAIKQSAAEVLSLF